MKASENDASSRRKGAASKDPGTQAEADAADLGDRVEALRDDVVGLRDTAVDAAHNLGEALREQLEARPYVTLAAAAGAGFVLAGGLTPKVMSTAVRVGGRLLASRLMREIFEPQA